MQKREGGRERGREREAGEGRGGGEGGMKMAVCLARQTANNPDGQRPGLCKQFSNGHVSRRVDRLETTQNKMNDLLH